MRNIRVQKKVVEILTDEEIAKILSSCDGKEPRGARMHAIVTLMLDTGLRFSEVITLKESEVDIDNGYLKVLGKGNKERMVPFGSASQKTVWRYCKLFRPEPIDTHSPQSISWRAATSSPFSRSSVTRALRWCAGM